MDYSIFVLNEKPMRCILLFILAYSISQAQVVLPMENGFVVYSDVIQADSISKDVLFINGEKWFATTYKSAQDVIQFKNQEEGEIIGKGSFQVFWGVTKLSAITMNIHHTVKLQFKDGRLKYTISDFVCKSYAPATQYTSGGTHEYPLESYLGAKKSEELAALVDANVQAMIASMKAKIPVKNSDKDW